MAHRRAGKTTASLNDLILRSAGSEPGTDSRFAFIAPTYKQAKDVAWDILGKHASNFDGVKFNTQELRADFINGSRVRLYGSDNPDALRGIGLDGVVFDEYSQQPRNIYSEIIRPALADRKGSATWIGTPKGKNDFYTLYRKAQSDPRWLALLLRASETGLIPQEELDDARMEMTQDEYDQEWECSFEAAIKGAYYAKEIRQAIEENRITDVPWNPMKKVYTWWDIGMHDSTAIGFFQRDGDFWNMIDYNEASGEGLPFYAKIIQDKQYIYESHFGPFDIEQGEFGTGNKRIEMAAALGIEFQIAPKLQIMEGINAGRVRFCSLRIDQTKCQRFLDAIALYRQDYNEKMGEFKPKPLHDWTSHAADMYRYFAVTNLQMSTRVHTTLPDHSSMD